ncbi:MAG: ankyrin repeat domain-containing protein [Steroidobacteraceae bacterium]|nr:ankyrin repeat domain-containing protein [Steroidobacteraceae bacterium]
MHLWRWAALALILCASGVSSAASLIEAIRSENRAEALARLEQGADANERSSDGTTALHWAAHVGDAELVKRLIKAGADVRATNDYGTTPVQEAAEIGDVQVLKLLLDAGADVESPNPEGQTALMTVARTNHLEAAKLLISRGANVNAREQWRGQTALMWAAAQSRPEMVKLLIKHGADVNARSKIRHWARRVTAEPRPQNRPPGGLTALLLAAREGCVACAEALVKGGADINLADPENISPLLMATLNARWDVAAYLIRAGADVNKWDMWGRAPLYSTVDYNTTPRGGRPDRPSSDATTPLQVMELLLKAGANPNMQLKLFPPYRSLGQDRGGDSMLTVGTTPLIRAAKAGDVPAIRLLLEHGAMVDLPNDLRITPLMAAAGVGSTTIDTRARFRNEQECIEAAKLLLKAGANINATRDNGQTALHGAALWGWNAFVQFLADNGANLRAADRNGITPLDVAMGKAGPTGRIGVAAAEPRPETAKLLQKLLAANE